MWLQRKYWDLIQAYKIWDAFYPCAALLLRVGYDADSGYYYNQASGSHYDPNSGLYYSDTIGAASGIGKAAARLFDDNGAFVVIADIQDELGHQVATSIGPGKCCYRHCDVREERQVQETVDHAIEKYGRLDIMFSNAGVVGSQSGILDLDMGELDRTMTINVRGVAATVKHAMRAMVAGQIQGLIICTASVAACLGGSGPHAYTISKHALVGLVRSASCELGKHGIRVNCISPFAVATPLTCQFCNLDPSQVEANCCAISNLKGIVLKPQAGLFLALDESSFISGHNLVVDGGFTVVSHGFSSSQ